MKIKIGNPNIGSMEQRKFEIMKIPEILIQEERGAQLFSLLLKAENPEWGEMETPLVKETTEFFKNNPLSPDILDTIREFHVQGVDEETLYNLALTYQHPERKEEIFKMIALHKGHVKNPEEIYKKLLAILESFNQSFSFTILAIKINIEVELDKKKRLERIEKTRKRIKKIIDFFKPDSKTTKIKRVIFMPTDYIADGKGGRAFFISPEEQLIKSHIDNILNQDHEFSHGIINPITDKLDQILTTKQKEKISKIGSGKLKMDYCEEYYSLLCEEFIRVYINFIASNERLSSYDDFYVKISSMTEEQFQKTFAKDQGTKARCDELGIKNIEELKIKSKEYFEKFEKNRLRDFVFDFYQNYLKVKDEKGMNFERFVLENFVNKLENYNE